MTDRSVDWDSAAADYHRTRGASEAWRDPVREALAPAPPGPIVDLGSGTGLWSGLLAAWTGRPVLALEPSAGMRAVAVAGDADTGTAVIHHLAGVGGALPLGDGSAAGAWLSAVIHHVGDVGACARELRRVLVPGAPVVMRGAFAGRYQGIPLVRYFPGARVALDRYPPVDDVVAAFGAAGFGLVRLEAVAEPSPGLRHWREGLPRQRRSDTALVGLGDDEFAAGLAAVDADIAAGLEPPPLGLDLLVLR